MNIPMPNCVPEFYRSQQDDTDHAWELREQQRERDRERYTRNQDKTEAAMEAGLPVLDFGGFEACWECSHADHETQTGPDDDLCTVICRNPACREHKKGR